MISESPRLWKVFGTGKSTPLLPTVNDFRGQPTDNLHSITGSFGMPMNAMESSMAPSGCDVLKSVPLANGGFGTSNRSTPLFRPHIPDSRNTISFAAFKKRN